MQITDIILTQHFPLPGGIFHFPSQPLSTKTIQTEIPVGEDFLWNVGLIYTFNKKYVEQ